ncbi:molecular chaperone [Paraburkholderia denitrificans]|uniref:Molecular chaperone n=1 Tax=Paraburkholderia denitrificans TaxID=694025 RepID=A0ABW0J931_9BURK
MGRVSSSVSLAITLLASSVFAGTAWGSVVLPHTRVIYDGSASERTLRLTNRDETPSVMQVWVDTGDAASTPSTANAPFVASPPVFRIEPNSGHSVRLVFVGEGLPKDRETLFYLNTLQIPAVSASVADRNRMTMLLRNRVKLFYRPAEIEGDPAQAIDTLGFHINTGKAGSEKIVADNGSGYYVSLVEGKLKCGSHTATFEPDMIAPYSSHEWSVKGTCPLNGEIVHVSVRYIDDYGAVRDAEYKAAIPDLK